MGSPRLRRSSFIPWRRASIAAPGQVKGQARCATAFAAAIEKNKAKAETAAAEAQRVNAKKPKVIQTPAPSWGSSTAAFRPRNSKGPVKPGLLKKFGLRWAPTPERCLHSYDGSHEGFCQGGG